MAKSELQEQYERDWQQKQDLRRGDRGMTGHYCIFLNGKYVAEKQQEECSCRPSKAE